MRPAAGVDLLTGAWPLAYQPRTPDDAFANLPPDRRPARERLPHSGVGAGGRLPLGHVRHRRRLPDDAAVDLRRHLAGGGGGERVAADRRCAVLRLSLPLAARHPRFHARRHVVDRRRPRHGAGRLAVHIAALGRSTRPLDRALLRHAARHHRRADGDRGPARHQSRAPRRPRRSAPARQSHLDPWPAAENALQALAHLHLGHSGMGHRPVDRLSRLRARHRRRLHPGADADLSLARADDHGHRHLHPADAGDHDLGHRHARDGPTIWSTRCWRWC